MLTSATDARAGYQKLDDINALYTTNYSNIITQYHTEYLYITGNQYTNPDTSTIDPAARKAIGNIYYPTGWNFFVPKVADQVVGSPVSNILVTGSTSTTVTTTSSTGISAGAYVVVSGPSGYAYGTVTSITSTTINTVVVYTITLNVLYGSITSVGTPSNNNVYISPNATIENEATTRITAYVNQMINGFNTSGSFNQTVSAFTSTTITVAASTGLSVGNPIIVYGSSGWAYGTVTVITPPVLPATTYTITINVTQGALSNLGTSISSLNKDAGFTLSDRNTGSVTGSRNTYFSGLKTLIDTAVSDWKTRLTAEQTALNLNDAAGSEGTQITTAKTNVAASLSVITTWQGYTTPGTRFGTGLSPLQTQITTRASQLTARSAEIVSALGSITQSSLDGSYTGSGNVYKYFDNINQRINLMTGTLTKYYASDLGIQAAKQSVLMAQSQASRDSSTFMIRTFAGDSKGTNVVTLTDVSGLTVGAAVKVMSNTQPVINTIVNAITDADVQLAASIPTTYTTADKARVVK